MRLSIIIPVYNVEKYISKCLESVIEQDIDHNDYEIIVVNDGSPDDSFKIAQDFAKRNTNIKLLDRVNGGVSSARNAGLDLAKGKYIYFLDSDDYLLPNSLKKILNTCETHDLDILTFGSASFSSISNIDKETPRKTNVDVLSNSETLSQIVTGQDYVAELSYGGEVWLYLINHEFLKFSGIRFIEGRLLEDAMFTLNLFLNAKRMAHLKFDAHRYRVSPGSAMTSNEPIHFVGIIRDLLYAAVAFGPIIKRLENEEANPDCIKRVKVRQQSFVFFSMIRMFKSIMSLKEIKQRIDEVKKVGAYPLDSFLGKEYNGFKYRILVRLLNNERRFYFIFQLVNPLFRLTTK